MTADPDATLGAETLTTLCASDTTPGVTVSVGDAEVTGAASTVAPITRGEPAVVPVNVAVYVPSPLSFVTPIAPSLVPLPFGKSTVAPPAVIPFPAASRAVSVSVTVFPEASDGAETVTVLCARESAPGITVIVGNVLVTASPAIVAPIVRAVPATVPMNVAVYVPSPLSAVSDSVPSLEPAPFVKSTASPPPGSALPRASRAVSVTTAVAPDVSVAVETVTSDWARETAPAVTVTVGNVDVIAWPSIVAPSSRAVPTVVALSVAVYVPSALSVTAEIAPSLVPVPFVMSTVRPPVVNVFPAASRVVSVSVAAPPAPTLDVDTVSVLSASESGPGVTDTVGAADVTALPPIRASIWRGVPTTVPVNVAT